LLGLPYNPPGFQAKSTRRLFNFPDQKCETLADKKQGMEARKVEMEQVTQRRKAASACDANKTRYIYLRTFCIPLNAANLDPVQNNTQASAADRKLNRPMP
jgi:hypothetical protein